MRAKPSCIYPVAWIASLTFVSGGQFYNTVVNGVFLTLSLGGEFIVIIALEADSSQVISLAVLELAPTYATLESEVLPTDDA